MKHWHHIKYIGKRICKYCNKMSYAEIGKIGNRFATKFNHKNKVKSKLKYSAIHYVWGHIK